MRRASALFMLLCMPALAGARALRYGQVPPAFEPAGDGSGGFRARSDALTVRALPGEIDLDVVAADRQRHHLRMRLQGARAVSPEPLDKLPGYSNYLLGQDPSRWRTYVPRFGGVRYRGIYPGIDLLVHARGQQLEYDWNISPGADPRRIRLRFDAAISLRVDAAVGLVATAGKLRLVQYRPAAYQMAGSARANVAAAYALDVSRHSARIRLGPYNHRTAVVVDPTLAYSVATGGSGYDSADTESWDYDAGAAIAVDQQGNAYVAGTTSSSDFPVTSNALQASPERVS